LDLGNTLFLQGIYVPPHQGVKAVQQEPGFPFVAVKADSGRRQLDGNHSRRDYRRFLGVVDLGTLDIVIPR
ncbi:MAG: hypothetical protein H5T92_10650, partial [Synergistales bacterium]|nr:hypothetical protein [Synergistales bacterium]